MLQTPTVAIIADKFQGKGLADVLGEEPYRNKVNIGPVIYPTIESDLFSRLEDTHVVVVSESYGGPEFARQATSQIREGYPKIGIVVLSPNSVYDDNATRERQVLEFMIAGANGHIFLGDEGNLDSITQTILIAHAGYSYFSISLQDFFSNGYKEQYTPSNGYKEQYTLSIPTDTRDTTDVNNIIDVLSGLVGGRGFTPREQDVLSYVVYGLSNKEISVELNLAEITVKKYMESIYSKIDIVGFSPTNRQVLLSYVIALIATGRASLSPPISSILNNHPSHQGLWFPQKQI